MKTFKTLGLEPQCKGDFVEVEIKDTAEAVTFICKYPEVFNDFEVLKGDMDNVFLKVTGKDIKEA